MALRVKIIADDKLSKSLVGIGKNVAGLGLKFAKFGLIGGAAIAGIGVKLAADLDKGLREIGTLMGGLTDVEMRNMGKELQIIASTSGQAMKSLVKARYDIVSAGFADAAKSAMLLKTSADLAVGGVTEVSTAADLLTTTLNAYNLSAGNSVEISDKLFTIVRLGKTTMTELGGSMGRVLAIAGQAGVSLDEVGAAMASLTAQGQKTEEATTAIRAAIVELLKPSEDMMRAIKAVGFETGVALIETEGFAGALMKLKEHADANNIPMTDLFSNIRAMQAVLPLTGTAMDGFVQNLKEMDQASGATAMAVEEMQKSFSVQMARLKQNVNNVLIAIGQALITKLQPIIEEANETLGQLGEIGWENIGAVLAQNWQTVLSRLAEIAWIGAQIIGLKFMQGIEAVITPDWWDKFVRASKMAFGMITLDVGMVTDAWKGSVDEIGPKLDELNERLWNVATEGYNFLTTEAQKFSDVSKEIQESSEEQAQVITDVLGAALSAYQVQMRDLSDTNIPNFIASVEQSGDAIRATTSQIAGGFENAAAAVTNLASINKRESKKAFKTWKAAAKAQAMVDTFAGAQASYKALAGIPIIGPVLGGIAAAAAITSGLARVAMIQAQSFRRGGIVKEMKGLALGGKIPGIGTKDTVPAILTPGEFVIRKEVVSKIGTKFLDKLNRLELGAALKEISLRMIAPEIPELQFGGKVPSMTIPEISTLQFGGKVPRALEMGGIVEKQTTITKETTPAQPEITENYYVTINALDGADVERVITKNADSFSRGIRDLKRRKYDLGE